MSPSESEPRAPYDISTVDLSDDRYEVKQPAIRNKYVVRDGSGNVVLRGKQKMLKLKEEFPFVTGDDEDAFTVKAGHRGRRGELHHQGRRNRRGSRRVRRGVLAVRGELDDPTTPSGRVRRSR